MKSLAFTFATLLTIQTATAQLIAENPEPNDSAAMATFLPVGMQAFGVLDGSNTDADWYRITLTSQSDLKVWTGPGQYLLYQAFDTWIALRDGNGVPILDSDHGDIFQTGLHGTFVAGDLSPGDYYIIVTGSTNWRQGYYALDAVAAPAGSLIPVRSYSTTNERPEQNDPRRPGGIATPSALDTYNVGSIGVGGYGDLSHDNPNADYDLYQLTIQAPCHVDFELMGSASPGAAYAPILHLLNNTFQFLAVSDPVYNGPALERLSFDFPFPGICYIAVSGFDGPAVGTYNLRISGPVTPIVVPSLVSMNPFGCTGSAGMPSLGVWNGNTAPATYAERPVLGSTYTLSAANLPANTPLFRVIGLLPSSFPVDLGLYGAPGCFVWVDPTSVEFALAAADGQHFWALPLPMNLQLVGLPLEQQLLVFDPAANALGLTTSGSVSSVCGLTH